MVNGLLISPKVLASYGLGLRTLTVSFKDFIANATTRLGEVLILTLVLLLTFSYLFL